MSTEDNQPAEFEQFEAVEEAPEAVEIEGDALLNLFVHLAAQDVPTGITIYTAGMAIGGTLISQKAYLEESLAMVEGKNRGMEIVFQGLLDHIGEPANPEGTAPNYRYVHLRSAQIMTSGLPGIPAEGGLMRFLRSEIAGWTSGKLEQS